MKLCKSFITNQSWNFLNVAVGFLALLLSLHPFLVFRIWYQELLHCLIHEWLIFYQWRGMESGWYSLARNCKYELLFWKRIPFVFGFFIKRQCPYQDSHFYLIICNQRKEKIAYIPLEPVADYVYIRLNNITTCWMKNATWLNFLPEIFPVLSGNPGLWEIDSKGKRNESNKSMSWSLEKAMSWSRGGTEGF